jgi:hypothetical protein
VALRALRLAVEQRPAARRIADAHGGRRRIEAGAYERDDRDELFGPQHERRHPGAGNARRDGAREVVIG